MLLQNPTIITIRYSDEIEYIVYNFNEIVNSASEQV